MLPATSSAGVLLRGTVSYYMSKFLAFGTTNGFFLVLASVDPLSVDAEAVLDDVVS